MNLSNVSGTLNRLSNLYHRLITAVFYRPLFRAIGSGTTIRKPILISNPQFISIGNGVLIRDGARYDIVTERFGQVFAPEVIIGDGALFEQGFHLACAESIRIGARVACSRNVSILDVWHHYEDIRVPIIDQPLGTAPVSVGEGTLIGMGSVILPGVTIGRHCMIGANSVVSRDIPDFCVAAGAPARIIRRHDAARDQWVRVSESLSESREANSE